MCELKQTHYFLFPSPSVFNKGSSACELQILTGKKVKVLKKLLSPTENTAPETPRQSSAFPFRDVVTSFYVTTSHISIIYSKWLFWIVFN